MSNLEQIHARLKTSRIAGGYKTATEFCDAHQIPLSTYNMHETGRRKILLPVADNYAKILQVNTGWLITGEGSPYAESQERGRLITAQEFDGFLNYAGNEKIQVKSHSSVQSINSGLYCSIFTAVVDALKSQHDYGIGQIASFSIEIYEDIIHTSQDPREQQAMIALAITILKKTRLQSARM